MLAMGEHDDFACPRVSLAHAAAASKALATVRRRSARNTHLAAS